MAGIRQVLQCGRIAGAEGDAVDLVRREHSRLRRGKVSIKSYVLYKITDMR